MMTSARPLGRALCPFGTVDPASSFCGLGQDLEPIAAQHIYNNPDLANEIEHLVTQGTLWAELYDWTGFWAPFGLGACERWASADFLGSGEVRWVTTDNDVFAWLGGHAQNNAWGAQGAGTLMLAAGGYTNINYHFRMTWNPDKPNENISERLNISRDPR